MYVSSNFGFLSNAIEKLEAVGLTLHEQISIITEVKTTICNVRGKCSDAIRTKMEKVFCNNKELKVLEKIAAILAGEESSASVNHTLAETSAFKYAPLTSVDVERSFSMYKSLLRSNRHGFLIENLVLHFVIYCNSHLIRE